jgi:hypothetical protein
LGYAKDSFYPDPTTATAFGIGLYDAQDAWEVTSSQQTTSVASFPLGSAVRADLPPGFAMTSGGCYVDQMTSPMAPYVFLTGVFLTASFPSSNTTWECQARAHITPSTAILTAVVVGIRPKDMTKPPPTVQITTGTSGVGSHVQAIAVGAAASGYVVTGGGAQTLPDDTSTGTSTGFVLEPLFTGQLLTGSYPGAWPAWRILSAAPFIVAPVYWTTPNAWYASSKDHILSGKHRVRAFAVNVKFD